MMETTAGATSSGSVAEVSQPMMSTQRRVNSSIYANQASKSDDHCPECKCNPCECHEASRKAPTAPKATEFGLWQNSVLAGKAQKDKKTKKETNESVKILKTTKTPTGKQVQGNYGLDYQPEEKLDMYGHSMRGSPKLHSPRIPDNKYPGQGPGRPENISSTDAFDVLKRDPFGRDSNMTEDDLEEDWEDIKNAGKKAIGAGAIGLAALSGGAQAQTAPANTGTNATIVKSLVNPVAQQRFAKLHSDTTAQLKDPKYTHNPDALAQHENYPKERHSQYIQNIKNIEQWQNPYQIISIALNKAGLTPQEVLQNLPKGYKLPSTEPKSEPVRIPGDSGYKAPVNEFKKSSRNINELEYGQGQRQLRLAEVEHKSALDSSGIQRIIKKMAAKHQDEKWTKEQLAALGKKLAAAGRQEEERKNKKGVKETANKPKSPDRNDPWEQGWYAAHRLQSNYECPYKKGTAEYERWMNGYEEGSSQRGHYDESVAEAVEDHTKIKVDRISSKYPGTNILTGSSSVRVGRKGKTPIGTFPTFEIDGHRYITLADGNKIERALRQDVAEGHDDNEEEFIPQIYARVIPGTKSFLITKVLDVNLGLKVGDKVSYIALTKGKFKDIPKNLYTSYKQDMSEATGDDKFDNMMGGIVQGVKKPSIGSRLMAPFKRMKDRGQVAAQSRLYKQMIDKYHNLASDSMNSTTDYEFDDERRFPHEDQFSKYMTIARYFEMLRGDMKLHAPFIQNIRKNNPELAKYQPLNAGKNSDLYSDPVLPQWVPAHNSILDIEHRPVKITHIGRPVDHLGVEWISAYERKHYEEFLIEDLENLQDFIIQIEDEINFNDEREGREGYSRDLDEAANAAQQAAIAIAKKKKGMTKQVDEIDMSIVGDALAGAALGAGSVGVGSYIGHKIANKLGQKFIDRANRKEAERQAKYDKEQCFGGSCDLDMDDWDDDEDLEEGKTGPGLWANIHKKQNRIKNGSGEHMRKPGSKGAPTSANFKAAAKTEGMSAKIKPIQELSSATLDRYKEKAKKSSDELTRQGKYRKANDRTMNVMKATGKQIDKAASGIRKALRNDESVAEGSNTKVTKTSSDIRAINKAAMKEISSLKKSKK